TTRTWYGHGQGPPPRAAAEPVGGRTTAGSNVEAEAPARAAAEAPEAAALNSEIEGGEPTAPVGAKFPPPVAQAEPLPPADTKVQGQPKIACVLPLSGPS